MTLAEISPQDLFDESWLGIYENSISAIGGQVVMLNSSLLVLERMLSFPFKLFEPVAPQFFWALVENSLFESCILVIWRIAVDTDGEVLSIGGVKNIIVKNIRAEYLTQLTAELRSFAFGQKIEAFRPRIKDIRDNYIAHFNSNLILNPNPETLKEDKQVFEELKQYTAVINDYFNFLCFGRQGSLMPWGYAGKAKDDLDVDEILSKIARDSHILNAPEKNPQLWPGIKQHLSPSEIDTLNHYRRKFGLSDI